MTLSQLKRLVDWAYDVAVENDQRPDSVPVLIQLNRGGDESDALYTDEDVEIHHDGNCLTTGFVISATLPKTPTASWGCQTCGWRGLDLHISQVPDYHRRWNSKQGKHCPGTLITDEQA